MSKAGRPTPEELVAELKLYSSRNPNVRKPQFHVAFSCKKKEMSHQELMDYADAYLEKMGYKNPGQPMIIYAHNDTDNNHIHVVTSRVAPDGHKIDHSHERRKSIKIIDELQGLRVNDILKADLEKTKGYSFSSITQFMAIMESMGYKCKKDTAQETVFFRKGSSQWVSIRNQEILNLAVGYQAEKKEIARLRAIFYKYRDIAADKNELTNMLHKKFGISIQFFGRKDSPYGYLIIDHTNKKVYKGGSVMKLDALLRFTTPEQKFDVIDGFLDRICETHPNIITNKINVKLRKYGAYIKNGRIFKNGTSRKLKPGTAIRLKENNRRAFINSFNPCSDEERTILSKLFKVDSAFISLGDTPSVLDKNRCLNILEITENSDNNFFQKLSEDHVSIHKENNHYVLVDFQNKSIHTLRPYDINEARLIREFELALMERQKSNFRSQSNKAKANELKRTLGKGEQSSRAREWEIRDSNMEKTSDNNMKL